jgi:hypothetical protein
MICIVGVLVHEEAVGVTLRASCPHSSLMCPKFVSFSLGPKYNSEHSSLLKAVFYKT